MLTKKNNGIYPLQTEKHCNTGEQISEAGLDWVVSYLLLLFVFVFFFSLAPPTIQSDDASIKRRSVVNECGAL